MFNRIAACRSCSVLVVIAALATAITFITPVTSAGQDQDKAEKTAKVGEKAPEFVLKDVMGKEHKLSKYKGKTVVLEWFSPTCPYIVKQHEAGPLETMGNEWMEQDVVWLAINSTNSKTRGSGVETNKQAMKKWSIEYPILLDESGDVGRLYKAKTTPHMFVIDPKGILVYQGAIDNAPSGHVKRGESFTNYVELAIDAVTKGKEVATKETKPYGCSVKYARKSRGGG
jgi:peroxiredoxin